MRCCNVRCCDVRCCDVKCCDVRCCDMNRDKQRFFGGVKMHRRMLGRYIEAWYIIAGCQTMYIQIGVVLSWRIFFSSLLARSLVSQSIVRLWK